MGRLAGSGNDPLHAGDPVVAQCAYCRRYAVPRLEHDGDCLWRLHRPTADDPEAHPDRAAALEALFAAAEALLLAPGPFVQFAGGRWCVFCEIDTALGTEGSHHPDCVWLRLALMVEVVGGFD